MNLEFSCLRLFTRLLLTLGTITISPSSLVLTVPGGAHNANKLNISLSAVAAFDVYASLFTLLSDCQLI